MDKEERRACSACGLARAVTFIDNHDTGSTQSHWPFPHDKVAMGYAYILTHPGTPCVFWDHYFDWGEHLSSHIKTLMQTRRELRHSQPKQARNHRRDRRFIRRRHRQKGGHQTRRRLVVPQGDGWSHVCGDHDWSVWRR